MNLRVFFLLLALLLSGSNASAQLWDINGLAKAINTLSDTAKDAAKMMKGAAGIGPKEEMEIGDATAVAIVGRYGGLVRDPLIMTRVNLVGRALTRYCDRPELNWRFAVLESDTVNAFSAPDGYVFITRALYNMTRDDDQLAGVLGHEIAHITGRHALKIVARSEFLSGFTSVMAKRSGDARQLEVQLKQYDLTVESVTKALFEKGFDPQTEYSADHEGRRLAELTGYRRGGLRGVLAALDKQGGDPLKVFSTHPPLAERVKRLTDEPPALPAPKKK